MESLAENIASLGNLSKKISENFKKSEKSFLPPSMNKIKGLLDKLGDNLLDSCAPKIKQADSFYDNLRIMFETFKLSEGGLLTLAKTRNSYAEKYKDTKQKLEKKKESSFPISDLKKVKIVESDLSEPIQDVLNDKTLAKKYMFPTVPNNFYG